MRKQSRSKKIKIKFPPFIEDLKKAFIKRFMNLAVLGIFLVVLVLLVRSFIHGSDYFKLRSVETTGLISPDTARSLNNDLLRVYKNKHIFDIDLAQVERSLLKKCPDAREIIVRLALPDKLAVTANFRRPVAFLDEAKYHPVDDDGFLLSQATGSRELPVIFGVGVKSANRFSKRIESRNLTFALQLLREIKKSKLLSRHHLTRIDASDINELSFYLDDDLEIRIGYENFKERLNNLKVTLRDSRLLKDRVKYIDVRYEDVTIGPK